MQNSSLPNLTADSGPVDPRWTIAPPDPAACRLVPLDLTPHLDLGPAHGPDRFLPQLGLHAALPSGDRTMRGIPFRFAPASAPIRWMSAASSPSVTMPEGGSHVVVAAAVLDSLASDPDDPSGDPEPDYFDAVGAAIAEFELRFDDGTRTNIPIRHGFEVHLARATLPAIAFAAVPHRDFRAGDWRGPHAAQNAQQFGPAGSSPMSALPGSWGPNQSGLVSDARDGELTFWLSAMPSDDKPRRLIGVGLRPVGGADRFLLVVGAMTVFQGTTDPLQRLPTRTLLAQFPGARDSDPRIDVDLGVTSRFRRRLAFTAPRNWLESDFIGWGDTSEVPRDMGSILFEVSATPDATLAVGPHLFRISDLLNSGRTRSADGEVYIEVLPARSQKVAVRVVDEVTGLPTASRVSFWTEQGDYLPPLGHRAEVNPAAMEDYGGDLKLGETSYAYVPGDFEIELPEGQIRLEIVKGFEYTPLRATLDVGPGTERAEFRLERPLRFSGSGWISADTHVHWLSPATALLEAQAEGVGMVHLLAAQMGEAFAGVADVPLGTMTDGAGTSVVMGTENRQDVLGHISLLGTRRPVMPLSTGGTSASFIGEPVRSLVSEWAERCRAQGGLAISCHFPYPYGEVAADVVAGSFDAVELFGFARRLDGPRTRAWYHFLNCGYKVPVVGGTDKISAGMALGAVRTYAQLEPGEEDGFDAFARSVRAGRTFITSGPMIVLLVDGYAPGAEIQVGADGGTVEVVVNVDSVQALEHVELVMNGFPIESWAVDGTRSVRLSSRVKVERNSWIAARAKGRGVIRSGYPTAVQAHTSPVYVGCASADGAYSAADAQRLLVMIQGAAQWISSIATVEDAVERDRLVARIRTAEDLLVSRMARHQVPEPLP